MIWSIWICGSFLHWGSHDSLGEVQPQGEGEKSQKRSFGQEKGRSTKVAREFGGGPSYREVRGSGGGACRISIERKGGISIPRKNKQERTTMEKALQNDSTGKSWKGRDEGKKGEE